MTNILNIVEFLLKKIEDYEFEYDGYVNGKASKLLFLSHYYIHIKKEPRILNEILAERQKLINSIEENTIPNLTLSYGLVGILYSLDYSYHALQQENEIEIDSEFCDYLLAEAIIMINEDNFDLFTGGIGIINYLVDNQYKYIKNNINLIINTLKEKNVDYAWKSEKDIINNTYNLGLSHGYPPIVMVLLKIFNKSHDMELKNFLIECIDKLLTFKNDITDKSYFPNLINLNGKEISKFSRLAWCYGDLGIGILLFNACQVLDKKYLVNAQEIARSFSKRLSLNENLVNDAGFCHGTAGIAHIINQYQKTFEFEELKSTYDYWISETLKMFDHNTLYSYEPNDSEDNYVENYGLLNGYCGIGIVLIDSISQNSKFIWSIPLLV